MSEVENYSKTKLTRIIDMKPRLQKDLVKRLKDNQKVKMVIHKQTRTNYGTIVLTVCRRFVPYKKASYHWVNVTCKDCLRRKE